MDIIFIVVLTIILQWALPKNIIGSFLASLMVYGILKITMNICCGLPIYANHLGVGITSFLMVAAVWFLTGYCRINGTNVQTLLGRET